MSRRYVAIELAVALAVGAAHVNAQERASSSVAMAGSTKRTRSLAAVRTTTNIIVDGKFDEPAWRTAPVADSFVQRAPNEGRPSSERTEVRILYDDDALYVAASLFDSRPESVFTVLGRRDGGTPSDEFFIALDSYHDQRTAFLFSVTPQGVQSDTKLWGEWNNDPNWNAVWQSATRRDSAGWYAEFRIPLSQLRFSSGDTSGFVWGINFFRWIARKGEDTNWSLIPRDGPPLVSYYGELRGMRLTRSPRRLELVPYSLARVQRSPGDFANPLYRHTDPFATVGADLRFALTSNFTLSATMNPDFGQVEADPSEVNLTGFESFFSEQRPFFVEGSDLLRYDLGSFLSFQETPFYSRRIGRRPQLDVPGSARWSSDVSASTILGAAKITGKSASGWSLAAITAMTSEERARFIDSSGGGHAYVVEPATQYAVARLTKDFRSGRSAIGALFTGVHRELTTADARDLLRRDAYVGGVEGRHRVLGDQVQLEGFAFGSYNAGSARAIDEIQRSPLHRFQRPDARYLNYDPTRTSLVGMTAGVSAWKLTGGNWRWGLGSRAYSPGFDMNDVGFQRTSDVIEATGWIGYNQNAPTRFTRNWWLFNNQGYRWNYAGERQLGFMNLQFGTQLQNFWNVFGRVDHYVPSLSSELLRGGPSIATPGATEAGFTVNGDRRRVVTPGFSARIRREESTPSRVVNLGPMLTTRIPAQLELSVAPSITWSRNAWQYVTSVDAPQDGGATEYVIGDLRQTTALVSLRANYTFSPTLTLQAYAQPFTSAGRYLAFARPRDPRSSRVDDRLEWFAPNAVSHESAEGQYVVNSPSGNPGELRFDDPTYNTQELLANAVLRWEYRPGSTLFVVWSQHRTADGETLPYALSRDAHRLFAAHPTNVLLVKVSYWMNR